MFEILPVTPALLDALGAEIGGCDFSERSQSEFLAHVGACDVQAAPGNGKTTLLAAKLALLSRNWSSRRHGVCVISHTNAARTEVEDLVARHPAAARLMSYPHFTGTVTAFVNQFIALPYLRGLGWSVRQIDDDAFAAEALRRYPSYDILNWFANKAQHGSKTLLEQWITGLNLDPAFADGGPTPASLAVLRRKRQHGADTKIGAALARLKASMVRSGFYRYADMTALAWRALRTSEGLADRIRARFPLVILDEAQDTHGEQLKLLEYLFKRDETAFQRLGDSNQTLYEDDAEFASYWTPSSDSIPLDTSRRFGADIASFASRLTARKAQVIVGQASHPGSRILYLFDETTIDRVIPAFATSARAHWGDDCPDRDLWAVASRHSQPAQAKGGWLPKSLVDYHPPYRAESGTRGKANLLCRQLQKAALHHAAGRPPVEVADMLATGIGGLARHYRMRAPNDRPINTHNIWAALAHCDLAMPRKVRRLLRDHVLAGDAVWNKESWIDFLGALRPLFDPPPLGTATDIADFCQFVAEQEADTLDPERGSTKYFRSDHATIRLGSIHSVKGKSVDGILVVESEVWKGVAAKDRCMDLATVLPHAFGVANRNFAGVELTAATNIFVAITRPRELLGLAVRKAAMPAPVLLAAEQQGWNIIDLVSPPPMPEESLA
ncbi:UvrD-helicase domain-containing protein [Sphingopyxis sp. Q841]|uniref:UvrD-helicase domain-containing protein n=1 Tax=Sphingopyxis sp. Q841 TaxID=3458250 RepID=UPI0040356AE7